MKTIAIAALIALAAPCSLPGMTPDPVRLVLTFEPGARTGAVMVSLFDSEAAYSGGGAPIRRARIDIAAGERSAIFADLPAGTYAAKAFHDVNGDGRMNSNPFGLPTEPIAFSNNAPANMGPPAWERARLAVAAATTQTITFCPTGGC